MGLDYTSAIKISAQWAGQGAVAQGKASILELKGQAQGSITAFQGAANAVRGFVAALAVREIVQYGQGILELADNLAKLSQKTGIGVQTLSNLKTAAELSGSSMEQLQAALTKFNVAAVNAASGNKETQGAFLALGVSVRNARGEIKDTDRLFQEVAKRFSDLKDGPVKAALAVRIFGRAGADLIPLLNEAGEGMSKFGLVLSDDFAKRAEVFNDSLTILATRAKQFGVDVLENLLPTLQEIVNAFSSQEASDALDWVDYLGEGLRQTAALGAAGWVLLEESFLGLKAILGQTIDTVKLLINDFVNLGYLGSAAIRGLTLDFKGAAKDLESFRTGIAKEWDQYLNESAKRGDKYIEDSIGAWQRYQKRVTDLQKNSLLFGEGTTAEIKARQRAATAPPEKRKRSGSAAGAELDQDLQNAIKATEDRIRKIQAETKAMGESNAARAIASEMAQLEARFTDKNSEAYGRLRRRLEEVVYAREVAKEKLQASEFLEKESAQAELRELELQQFRYSSAEYQKLIEFKKIDIQVSQATRYATDEGRRAMLEAGEAAKKLKGELIDLAEENKQAIGPAAQEFWRDYAEAAKDTASQVKMVLTDAFRGAEDAFVDFVRTGKLSFASLAAAIEEDLLRIAFRRTIAGIGSSIFGTAASAAAGAAGGGGAAFAMGGVMSSKGPIPLRKYASGGIARSPQIALFGEGSRPEAYVPLPDGRNIPAVVDLKGAGMGGVTVNVSVDRGGMARSETDAGAGEQGRQLGKAISAGVIVEIQKQMRPGGLLAK